MESNKSQVFNTTKVFIQQNKFFSIPNIISLTRIALVFVFLILFLNQLYIWAFVVFVISGISDFLDGYLARKLNQVTKFGTIIDPLADRLYILLTLLVFSLTGFINIWVFIIVIVRDLINLLITFLLAQMNYAPIKVIFLGKLSTACIYFSLPFIMIAKAYNLFETYVALFNSILLWGITLYVVSGVIYLINFIYIKKNFVKSA